MATWICRIDARLTKVYGRRLGVNGIAVYAALSAYADSKGKCFPKIRTIANDLDVSERTVMRAIKLIAGVGLVEVVPTYDHKGGRTSNTYRLLPLPPGDTRDTPPR
jgi:hypothetical protein